MQFWLFLDYRFISFLLVYIVNQNLILACTLYIVKKRAIQKAICKIDIFILQFLIKEKRWHVLYHPIKKAIYHFLCIPLLLFLH